MQIDRDNRRGRFAVAGKLQPEDAASLAVSAITAAGAENLRTLLLNLEAVTLARRMSVTDCFLAGQRLAEAGAGLLKLAVVASRECIRDHELVFTAASNRGLATRAFASEQDALGWLAAR
jgi:hypothetical protein